MKRLSQPAPGRLVIRSEPEGAERHAEARIKELTAGEPLQVRPLVTDGGHA